MRQTALITRRAAQDNSLGSGEGEMGGWIDGCRVGGRERAKGAIAHNTREIPTMLTMSFVFPKRRKEFSI